MHIHTQHAMADTWIGVRTYRHMHTPGVPLARAGESRLFSVDALSPKGTRVEVLDIFLPHCRDSVSAIDADRLPVGNMHALCVCVCVVCANFVCVGRRHNAICWQHVSEMCLHTQVPASVCVSGVCTQRQERGKTLSRNTRTSSPSVHGAGSQARTWRSCIYLLRWLQEDGSGLKEK